MKFRSVLVSFGSIVLAGCSTIPTAGPTVSQVFDQAVASGQRYFDLVDVDNHVVTTLLLRSPDGFRNRLLSYGKPPPPKVGIGDTVSVSIWEASGGGLFGAPAAAGMPGAAAGGAEATIPARW